MFGEFSISHGEINIKAGGSRSKVWLLLSYLISHRSRLVPREELLRVLGTTDGENPGNILRIYRSRARKLLEPIRALEDQELIVSSRGAYGWNPAVPTEVDADLLESACKARCETEEEIENLFQALPLYRGEFLSNFSSETWVSSLSSYYRSLFLNSTAVMVPLLQGKGRNREAAELCRRAITFSPYDEPLYRALIESLADDGDYEAAAAAYEELRRRLLNDLDVLPSAETQEAYERVTQNLGDGYIPPERLRRSLRETVMPTGAMICDFASFKLFYQAEARSADRRGDAIHIGILSVEGRDGTLLTDKTQETAMSRLREKLRECLRIGDIAACCSASQYIVMLVQANYENSKMVLDRVVRAYRFAYPNSPARVRASVIPLEPLFDVADE